MGVLERPNKQNQKSIKAVATSPAYVNRFAEVLGGQEKANQFLANVITAVNQNYMLTDCKPEEVLACAMTAAALNLDVVPGLGFAAIVPYKDKKGIIHPQFQIMKNGFVQLAMRSNELKTINVTDLYEDEIVSFNRLTGELIYREVPGGQRELGLLDKIAGYACYVQLCNGFEKVVFWGVEKIKAHARTYSQAYRYDLEKGKQASPWSTNFAAMAEKTVIKAAISKWVPMSTQMVLAQKADQSTEQKIDVKDDGSIEAIFAYGDNENDELETDEKPLIPNNTSEAEMENAPEVIEEPPEGVLEETEAEEDF